MKHQRPYRVLSPPSRMRSSRRSTPSPPSTDADAPYEQAPLPDDLVPSLPPDWEPPSYSQEMPTPQSASSEGAVIHM